MINRLKIRSNSKKLEQSEQIKHDESDSFTLTFLKFITHIFYLSLKNCLTMNNRIRFNFYMKTIHLTINGPFYENIQQIIEVI